MAGLCHWKNHWIAALGLAVAVVGGAVGAENKDDVKPPTMLVLDAPNHTALWVQGHGKLTIDKGDLVVNGTLLSYGAEIKALDGRIGVGQKYDNPFRGTCEPFPIATYPVEDPLARYVVAKPTTLRSDKHLKIGEGSLDLLPGLYIGGLEIGINTTIRLQPGVYYLLDGDLSTWHGAKLTGRGVTIVLGGQSPGGISLAGDTLFDLTAPSDGPTKGCVLMAYAGQGKSFWVNGNLKLGGVFYAPNAFLSVAPKGQIVADRLVCKIMWLNTNDGNLEITGASDYPTAPKPPDKTPNNVPDDVVPPPR